MKNAKLTFFCPKYAANKGTNNFDIKQLKKKVEKFMHKKSCSMYRTAFRSYLIRIDYLTESFWIETLPLVVFTFTM